MEPREVTGGVWVVQCPDYSMNAVIIASPQRVVVVDSLLLPQQGEILVRLAQELTGRPPGLLVNTHGHRDHIFGNQAFSCPIISSERCRRFIQGTPRHHWTPQRLGQGAPALRDVRLTPPDVGFSQELTLDLGEEEAWLYETGGHAPGHCVVYLPRRGVLIAGDLVLRGLSCLIDAHIEELMMALHQLQRWGVRHVIPGHGDPEDAQLLADALDFLGRFTADVQRLATQHGDMPDITRALVETYAGDDPILRQWLGMNVERLLVGPTAYLQGQAMLAR